MSELERGWLPDFVYRDGNFESSVALFVNTDGTTIRFSSAAEDLAKAVRLPRRAILPGLVNAHSHAFQRAIRARTEHRTAAARDSFWTWREAMYYTAQRLSPEDLYDVSRMAFLEMLLAGITTVGEFHYLHNAPDGTRYEDPNLLATQVIKAAIDTGLRIALLRTAYNRAGWRKELHPAQARFVTKDIDVFIKDTEALAHNFSSDRAWVGVAPHSVRALPLPYLLETVSCARSRKMPVHMHVAEQPGEIAACEAEHGLRPVELLEEHGILAADFTAVHATHTTAAEAGYLLKANICVCPTTERNLGDGIAPARAWFERGINVCFGSDSNVQIDLLEDARELEYHLRLQTMERALLQVPDLFQCATVAGSKSLAAAQSADFIAIDLDDPSLAGADSNSLLTHVIFALARSAIRDVYVAGKPVIQNGFHREQEEIIRRFTALQKRLWQ
jgi:formimidoylglutamate deiminase